MIRVPAQLLRRLALLFPDPEERDRFVADSLETAMEARQRRQSFGGDDGGIVAMEDSLPEPAADPDRMIGGTLHVFSDGGSRGNPGQAAIACILEDPVRGVVLEQHYERIGVETNNVAEYRALIAGLKMALRYSPNRLICHLDSELVVKQVNGEYQVKMATLKPFVDEIRALAMQFADVVFVHIPREDNHRADALVNKALDEGKRAHSVAARSRMS
jgi:ribonuclease HI